VLGEGNDQASAHAGDQKFGAQSRRDGPAAEGYFNLISAARITLAHFSFRRIVQT
jgi:hypothetical protein